MGSLYPQICRAFFKSHNQPWALYKMQLIPYLGRKMLRKHRTKCNNCCTPVIKTFGSIVRNSKILVKLCSVLALFPANWFVVFPSDSLPVLQHFLKHLLQGRWPPHFLLDHCTFDLSFNLSIGNIPAKKFAGWKRLKSKTILVFSFPLEVPIFSAEMDNELQPTSRFLRWIFPFTSSSRWLGH